MPECIMSLFIRHIASMLSSMRRRSTTYHIISAGVTNDANMFERIKGIFEIIKEYGTLPFANLARYAFVAVAIMKSLVRTKHLSEFELEQFMQSLCTVSQDLIRDLNALRSETITEVEFLNRYGHLRPGAYDICSKRYDEAFDTYFHKNVEEWVAFMK